MPCTLGVIAHPRTRPRAARSAQSLSKLNPQELTQAVLARARDLGADLAGVAGWDRVRTGPSYAVQPFLRDWHGVGAGHPGRAPGPALSFAPASLVVVGLSHPEDKPKLDWWQSHIPSRTLGNVKLAAITTGLADWLSSEHGVAAVDLAYHVERGGVFLKDAAVLAGLGVVGRNNLFLCPEFGPRVRLRALAVEARLEPGEPLAWDPCVGCAASCHAVCPSQALASGGRVWPMGAPANLPGRDGSYERVRCNQQMEADIAAGREVTPPGRDKPCKQVRYCRRCELACPVGRRA